MSSPPPTKLDAIAESAAAIEHSRWGNRLVYLGVLTGAIVVALGLAIFRQARIRHLDPGRDDRVRGDADRGHAVGRADDQDAGSGRGDPGWHEG